MTDLEQELAEWDGRILSNIDWERLLLPHWPVTNPHLPLSDAALPELFRRLDERHDDWSLQKRTLDSGEVVYVVWVDVVELCVARTRIGACWLAVLAGEVE